MILSLILVAELVVLVVALVLAATSKRPSRTKFSCVLIVGILCPVLTVVVVATIEHYSYVYPTPDKESVFLQNYTPPPLDGYRGGQAGSSSSAGRTFVTNTRDFQPCLTLRSGQRDTLIKTLSDDMSVRLLRSGAEILSQSGDPHTGFHVSYKIGKSIGSATISPFAQSTCAGFHTDGTPVGIRELGPGTEVLAGSIAITEKWFPKEPNATQARLEVSSPI